MVQLWFRKGLVKFQIGFRQVCIGFRLILEQSSVTVEIGLR